jgi:hypothetical protein
MDVFGELIKHEPGLLSRPIEDLAPISFIGTAAVAGYRSLIGRLDSIPMTEEQKAKTLKDGQEAGAMLLAIEGRIGEISQRIPRAPSGRTKTEDNSLPKKHKRVGMSPKQVSTAEAISNNPEIVADVIAEAEENEDIPTKTAVISKVNAKKEKARQKEADSRDRKVTDSLSVTAKDLQMRMMQALTLIPPKMPKGLSGQDKTALCALAETIVHRLEGYCGS